MRVIVPVPRRRAWYVPESVGVVVPSIIAASVPEVVQAPPQPVPPLQLFDSNPSLAKAVPGGTYVPVKQ